MTDGKPPLHSAATLRPGSASREGSSLRQTFKRARSPLASQRLWISRTDNMQHIQTSSGAQHNNHLRDHLL